MKYKNTTRALFLDRPNRFIAHVKLNDKIETVHVKNTGKCNELLVPGATVILEKGCKPERKTDYDLIAVYKQGFGLVNMDSQAPNKVVYEWLLTRGYDRIKPEYTYGQSRFDFYMERGNKKCFLEVKGCTLEQDGIGYFPDARSERAVKHLRELIKATHEGYECSVAFVIQMENVKKVLPNGAMHKEFEDAYYDAIKAGVKVYNLCCMVREDELRISATTNER